MVTKNKGYGAWEYVDTMPSCTNDCQQGRKPCPTPVACRVLLDTQDPLAPARGAVIGTLLGAAIWACLLFIGVSVYFWWFA